ncbi:MAG TPA: hypothetical protein VH478_11600 [Trebonia sp.]|nr:hypothetical protein [Trebonia sp.]
MAWVLVQLKLRQLLGALKSTGGAKASFIISSSFAVLLALGTFVLLAAVRGNGAAVGLTAAIYTTLAFGWLLLPLMVFGLDATLDPATLAIYPLRLRPLAVGLVAASATGVWPLANLIGALGVTVGVARGALGVLFAILAALLQVLFCITLARLATTSLAGLLRSRRGRDLAALAIIPVFGLYETFAQVLPKAASDGTLTAGTFAGVDRWLRWLPPGMAAHAVQDASTGHALAGLGRLALLAGIIAVLAWLWVRSLARALVTADASTQAAAVRSGGLPFGRVRGPWGTVAARALVYERRDPSSLVAWGISAIVMIVTAIGSLRGGEPLVGILLSAGFGGAFTAMVHDNRIGLTGFAFYLDALALSGRKAMRGWFLAQDAVLALIAVPLVVIIPLVLAVIVGHPADCFLAWGLGLAAVGAGLGLSNLFSATSPWAAERRAGSPSPRPVSGYAGQSVASRFGTLLGTAVLVAPVIAAIATTGSVAMGVRAPALIVAGGAYGTLLAWAGATIAGSVSARTLPELVQVAARTTL